MGLTPATARPALKIGPLAVDPPVVLAPMAGVTNAAFRRLCRSYGAGLYVNEMVSARAIVEGNAKTEHMVSFDDDEPVRSVQLYGVDPEFVAAAIRRVIDAAGADHIDLNMGCPSPKVTRRGGGAALPAHHRLFALIVRAAVQAAGPVPVTVKMRMGVTDEVLTYLRCGQLAADEGAAAIALHARTAEQLYSGRARWPAIAELKATVTEIPVLGNGDIWTASDAIRMREETGCDGVVVGRGCLGRPWLFRDLADAFAGREPQPGPDLGGVISAMRHHAELLAAAKGSEHYAMRDFRKHVGWYLTGFPVGPERRRRLALISSLADLDELTDDLDPTIRLAPGAEALPRGHAHGPRPVTLPAGWLDDLESTVPPFGADVLTSGG
jgi:nifR3 family TIM-barrel protein